MSNYSSQKAEVTYEWEGLNVRTVIHIPHSASGVEAVNFLTRLVDALSLSYNNAERGSRLVVTR